eukprot:15067807-Ditylum_brightwellii.AAC.1
MFISAILKGRKIECEEVVCNTEKQHTVPRPVQNEGTNGGERPILTVSTCTGMSKVVTILCAVFPIN